MPNIIKFLSRSLFAWQYTSGKFTAIASLVTMATVLSIKFNVAAWLVFSVCAALIIATGVFFKYSGWMAEEMKYVNRLGDLERKLDILLRETDAKK